MNQGESVRHFIKTIPAFGQHENKEQVFLFENGNISMAFRCVTELLNDSERVLFILIRDFSDSDPQRAMKGVVWEHAIENELLGQGSDGILSDGQFDLPILQT